MIVSFSGIDGSGKSTYSSKLCEMLKKRGYMAKIGIPEYNCNSIVKNYCRLRFNDEHAYYPLLDSKFYLSTIALDWINWLQSEYMNNTNVIYCCDRYLIDTYTQAIQYNCELTFLQQLFEIFPKPDLSFFLNIEPESADKRLRLRKYPPRHSLESFDELKRLNESFKTARAATKWSFIDVDPETDINKNLENILEKTILKYEKNKSNNI